MRAKETGQSGELLAARYLQKKGFQILERNFRHKKAEIDLIISKDNLLVFVEVKTRANAAFGHPEAFVTDHQKKMIRMAAVEYMENNQWPHHIRFDIVAITYKPVLEVMHLPDAF